MNIVSRAWSRLIRKKSEANSIPTGKLQIYTRYRRQANMVRWKGDTSYSANKYLLKNLNSLKICRECFQLYGAVRLTDGQLVEQQCQCRRSKQELWHVSVRGHNLYNDFNVEYEICNCCGLEVIPSGSRWSLFYCRTCKDMIRELNDKIGKCIIPIGRHSLMNGISLSGENAKNKEAIAEFVTSVNEMNQSIIIVSKHEKKIIRKQVERLQMAEDAPAIDLILKSNDTEIDHLKKEAFLELVALAFRKTTDEVREFYHQYFGNEKM
jgi:vacuolar-type H+-ATPase subunit F/Vma7